MKQRHILTTILLLTAVVLCRAGQIGEWTLHLAYNNVTELVRQHGRVYALAGGAVFSVDIADGSTAYYNKQTGLHGSTVSRIAGNEAVGRVVFFYEDGLIDLLDAEGNAFAITDLLLKDMSENKTLNNVVMYGDYAYCSMSFGIMVLNLRKREIADSYYIGEGGRAESVVQTAIFGDSIYAVSATRWYAASVRDNLSDYNRWHSRDNLPGKGDMQDLAATDGGLCLLRGGQLWLCEAQGGWQQVASDTEWTRLRQKGETLYCISRNAVSRLENGVLKHVPLSVGVYDAVAADGGLWLAAGDYGVAFQSDEGTDFYRPDGPAVNSPYRMMVDDGRLFVVPGGRWSSQNQTPGCVMIYDGHHWTNISNDYITGRTQYPAYDFMNVAVDPADRQHFYVTSYGMGLYEFHGTELVRNYTCGNSPLASAAPGSNAPLYVRTDGALFDRGGNLWLLNTSAYADNVHVLTPQHRQTAPAMDSAVWTTMNLTNRSGERTVLQTPLEMLEDNQQDGWLWIPFARSETGLGLLDNNGTPTDISDDRFVFRFIFTDQDHNSIRPENIYCVTQDREGTLWIGHKTGLFIIPSPADYFTSDACERIKIPRNDGTNLADYLLNGEQVNVIAVDGSNRKWIGTESSGLYLMSDDGVTTVEHFTTDNSPLLSDKIMSLAIDPVSGLVYVGTERGLMAYQSDAADPMPDYSSAYAYPNPVREDYDGVITIAGLMDETTVHILDSGGNLVCETYSNGGIAVWDGRNGAKKRVSSGVYTALCNTADGNNHTVVKIMIVHQSAMD